MKAKFANYAAAAVLAGGLFVSSAFAPAHAASTHPKLSPGHYDFDAYAITQTPSDGTCPFQVNDTYRFHMVYSASGNSTIRLTPAGGSGSKVVILSIPKKTGSGTWNATYTANAYDQTGTNVGSWTGSFSASGVPADTESIALLLTLTGFPDPTTPTATTCSATFNASGAMTGTGN